MLEIGIGRVHYLLYLLLSHPLKMALLSPASRVKLDDINPAVNERIYSGRAATHYDELHRYGETDQHEYPARLLIEEVWGKGGYGCALDVGAGSGYFTRLIAPQATSVLALEPVPDMQRVLRARCDADGLLNVEVIGLPVLELGDRLPPGSVDSVLIVQSFHHFHRRPEVIQTLARVLRPGGRLLMLEPHHNLRRVARLFRNYLSTYRRPTFWAQPENWATHDSLTCGEIGSLCRQGGFADLYITGFWFPYSRRLVPDPRRRFRLEQLLGRIPLLRHFAGVLAVTARRL